MCLVNYIPLVKDIIQNLYTCYSLRKQLIEALKIILGK